MDRAGTKRGRAPLGDVSNCALLGFSLNHHDTLIVVNLTSAERASQIVGSRELKLQRERIRNASMTDEQRDEGNKKRCKAYRKKKENTTNKENKSGIYVLLHHIIRINCYISCVVAPHLLRWPEQKLSHPAQMTFVSVGNAWIKLKIIPVMSLRPLHQVSVGNYNVCYLEFTRILIECISI